MPRRRSQKVTINKLDENKSDKINPLPEVVTNSQTIPINTETNNDPPQPLRKKETILGTIKTILASISRETKIIIFLTIIGLILTAAGTLATWTTVPEIRQWLGLTNQTLPAPAYSSVTDSIVNFRVVKQSKSQVEIEVEYTYNPIYGERVYAGACLYRNGRIVGPISNENEGVCEYFPGDGLDRTGKVPSIGSGKTRIIIVPDIKAPEASDEIEIWLNKHGQGNTLIVSRKFPFIQEWRPN
jgi:hypothetical protein